MQDKWHIKNKKKGYLKIHVAVNVKTKKILSMKVTAMDMFMIAKRYSDWLMML